MKWCFVIICFASVCLDDAIAKNILKTKNQLGKKASSVKPTKHPKAIADVFREFPADDREFIKQLDKQFEKFGDNVKIKIEKENRTTSKNTKRTIDGSLGYGYYSNQNDNSYYFSKPRYQVYPYSQQDIPPSTGYDHQQQQHQQYVQPNPHGHDYSQPQRLHTTVEIQRSHGYEIKPEDTEYKTIFEEDEYPQQGYQHSGYENQASPVIVLRIPGPAKYALHLQALLQQYLEIRAAQYIQVLQEQEARSLSSQSNHYNEQEISSYHPQQQNAHAYPQPVYGPPQYQTQQVQGYSHAELQEHGQQTGEGEPSPHDQSHQEPQIVYQQQQEEVAPEQHYQNEYEQSYQPEHKQQEEEPEQQPQPYAYEQPSHEQSSDQLLTTENFPDNKHTQVIFKSTTQQPHEYLHHEHSHTSATGSDGGDPNAHVQTYNAPLVYHQLEQYYGDEQEFLPSSGDPHGSYSHGHTQIEGSSEQNYVTITQRPHAAPYNYHAHPPQEDGEYATQSPSRARSAKRQTQFSEEQYKKFHTLMNRLKKKMSSIHAEETANGNAEH